MSGRRGHRGPVETTAPRRSTAGVAVVVTLLAGGATSFAADPRIAIPVLALLIGAVWWTHRSARGQLRDATILVAALWLFLAIPSPLLWPLSGLLALVLTALWARRRGRWPQWRAWLRVGRIGPFAWAMCAVIALMSVVGLLIWNHLADGELPPAYSELAQSVPLPAAVAGAFAFFVINGAIEDSIWAGVLLSATERLVPPWLAITTVAASFGLAHLHGVPDGPIGVLMAGSWGLVLALLRLRTGGMGATYLAHVVADATIAAMLLPAALA